MNKLFNLGAMLTIAAGAAFVNSSCSSNDMSSYESVKQQEFKQSFTTEFGNIATNHNWGFTAQAVPNIDKTQTKAAAPNSNQWFDPNQQFKLVQPNYITEREIYVVSQWFKEHKNPVSTPVNLTDFFVMQVYNESAAYKTTNKDNREVTVAPDGHMNWICVEENGNPEPVNNLNSNAPTYNAENNPGSFPTKGIQYMQNSSSMKFGYEDSYGTDKSKKWDFVICAIDVDGEIGYYVGYDYSSSKPDEGINIEKDGYYNDRILKVVPACHSTQMRIIAEDLGAAQNSDFDYNDVVFDAFVYQTWDGTRNKNVYRAVITLLAAGGTLPIYIGDGDDMFEVHEAFGVSTKTMINTVAGKKQEYAPVQKDIFIAENDNSTTYDINNIKVRVQYGEGDTAELVTLKGEAPQKICVEPTYKWCDEYEKISGRYPNFNDYVSNPNVKWY